MTIEYQCGRCGSSITFELCPACGGDGYLDEHDCFEDSCCCLESDPEECFVCDGEGAFPRCVSSFEWCEAHPMPGHENVARSTAESFAVPSRKRKHAAVRP